MEVANITSESIASDIISMSEGRFVVSENENLKDILQEITPESLEDRLIISLKRDWPNSGGERTLIITVLNSLDEFKTALQWAASVRDELLEPANGDLYLFAVIKDSNLSRDQCTDLESSDRICRRYVLRPTETIEDLLNRSFIAPVMGDVSTNGISDPLRLALGKTAVNQQWFTQEEQENWQKVLLSGKTGQDLIEALFHL